MTARPPAVFLSYASQDAEIAKRIAESLRAAGVEVWFDVEGGLETGDEWDAKIRRQIKECVLFIPVISANTQAREEGYFRIEWDLAAERARGIASGVAFILPVVIDDTREPDALVPDRFRSVQWTRATAGELSPATQAKFAKLWSHRAGLAKHKAAAASAGDEAAAAEPAAPERTASAPRPTGLARLRLGLIVGGAAALLGVGVLAWKFLPGGSAAPATPPAPAATIPAARDWPRSPELKRAVALLDGLEVIPEDFRLAEEIAARELELRPADPEAVTVMARVHGMWLLRGWDRSSARYQRAKSTAERALQLAPDEPEAQLALAVFLYTRNVELPRALALAQRAVDARPDEPRFHRMRDNCLFNLNVPATNVFLDLTEEQETPGMRAALDSARRTVALFPRDPLVRYELARHYRDLGRWADFERVSEETIALYPVANALVWKARARFGLHGDLPGMKAVLDQVPARVRAIERTVFGYFLYAAYTGEVAVGHEALIGFTEPWMIDFDFRGPKSLLVAELLELGGRKEMARIQYDLALTELKQSRLRNPEDLQTYLNEAWILRGLGRADDARAALRTFNEALQRPFVVSPLSTWWFQAIPANLLIGDRAFALTLMREAIAARPDGRETLRRRFAIDPRLAGFRDDAEIKALLAETAPASVSAPAAPSRPASEAEQLATRAIGLTEKVGFTRDDLAAAEDLARRAVEREPDSALAWGARAWVHAAWTMRGWDNGEARRQETQTFANRSLALDPNQPDALYALSYVFTRQGALEQAEAILRKAMAAAPGNARIARTLGSNLVRQGRREDAIRHLQEVVARFPRDPLVRYEFALVHAHYGFAPFTSADMQAAEEQLDAAIALQPFSSALLLRALIAAVWHDDYETVHAKLAELSALPLAERTEDRTVAMLMWINLISGQYDQVAAASSLTSRNHFEDAVLLYPHKHWLLALALERQGKPNLARARWQDAEPLLRQRAAETPANLNRQIDLAITLARLGSAGEARAIVGKIEPAWREELTRGRPVLLAMFYASLGEAARAVDYLRPAIERNLYLTRHTLRRDPWWDKIRDSAEFQAMLAQLGPQP